MKKILFMVPVLVLSGCVIYQPATGEYGYTHDLAWLRGSISEPAGVAPPPAYRGPRPDGELVVNVIVTNAPGAMVRQEIAPEIIEPAGAEGEDGLYTRGVVNDTVIKGPPPPPPRPIQQPPPFPQQQPQPQPLQDQVIQDPAGVAPDDAGAQPEAQPQAGVVPVTPFGTAEPGFTNNSQVSTNRGQGGATNQFQADRPLGDPPGTRFRDSQPVPGEPPGAQLRDPQPAPGEPAGTELRDDPVESDTVEPQPPPAGTQPPPPPSADGAGPPVEDPAAPTPQSTRTQPLPIPQTTPPRTTP